MKSFARLAVGFLMLALVIIAFAYFLGPPSYRAAFRGSSSPVGQLESNAELKTPGQPAATDENAAKTTQPESTNADGARAPSSEHR